MAERRDAAGADSGIPAVDRLRMACSVGAVLFGLMGSDTMLSDLSASEVTSAVREVVTGMLAAP